MRPSGWLFITQLCICVALAASAALYVHYLSPLDSGYCGPNSGCEAARQSGLGYFFGSRFVSLPLFSLLAFGALLAISLRRLEPRTEASPVGMLAALRGDASFLLFAASGVGATVGIALLAYQAFVLGQYCWLCLIVDVASVLCAVFALATVRGIASRRETARSPLRAGTWFAVAALIVAGPLVWDAIKPPPAIPRAVAALYQPGKINVVEFADFECPYCRRLHGVLGPLLTEYGDAVHFVRAQRPLPMHPHADHAARAAVCAEAQGKGEAMANGLFQLTLSDEAISRLAEGLRLDPMKFDHCLTAPETDAVLAHDEALLPDEELRGLPTTYVGARQFVGVPTEAALRDALDRARTEPAAAPSGTLYAGVLAALIGLVGFFGRRRGH